MRKLEREYGNKIRIFLCYLAKLLTQIFFSITSIGVSIGVFRDFSFSFNCTLPLNEAGYIINELPQNETIADIHCVHTGIRMLYVVWIVDLILTGLVGLLAILGLTWCCQKHVRELEHSLVAEFAFVSLLEPDAYRPPPKKRRQLSEEERPSGKKYFMCANTRIRNDYSFLLLSLYRSDTVYGEALREINVSSLNKCSPWIIVPLHVALKLPLMLDSI